MNNEHPTSEEPTQAVVVVENPPPAPVTTDKPKEITPEQAKVEAIANLTMSAYQKAATLNLTAEETAMLQEDFPDDAFRPGAAGKEHLLYIEHAFLRERFIKVFGMGGWAIIPRKRWAEPFFTPKGVEGSRIYVEAMLVVRGCFVAEAVGEMEYYPKNPAQNYGDAVEGAKTAAFRRCAKEFGVGLQAWKHDWCQGWWDRKMAPGKRVHPKPAPEPDKKPEEQFPTEEQKAKFLTLVENIWEKATQYCIDIAWLMPNEPLKDIQLKYIPTTQGQFNRFMLCLKKWEETGVAEKPYTPHIEPDKPKAKAETKVDSTESMKDDPWRTFPMPFGKNAGVNLEDLEKNYLFGLWANYKVETTYKGKPRNPEKIELDKQFRLMLDLAGAHYEFKKKD